MPPECELIILSFLFFFSPFAPLRQEPDLQQVIGFCDKVNPFVNREQAIARIFCINTLVAEYARVSPEFNQRLGVPLLTHTYGAGKSKLATNYVRRLREDADTRAAITAMAATPEFADIKGAITAALAHFQAEGDAAPLSIRVEAQADLDSIWMVIAKKASGVRHRINVAELLDIISDVRRTRAVALFIDEVGRLEESDGKGYERYQKLRDALVMLIKFDN